MPFKFTIFSGLVALLLLLAVTSCHKNNETPASGPLVGNYNFSYLTAKITLSTKDSVPGDVVNVINTSQYTTTQNTGTVTFTSDSVMGKGVGYTANTTVKAYEYKNGVLQDSLSQPKNASVPATSSSSKYQLIGKDSIYFPGGGLLAAFTGTGGGTATLPAGGHYTLQGDSLSITSIISQVTPPQTAPNGETISSSVQANVLIVMKKQ